MSQPPAVRVVDIEAYERDVTLRLPFRFGIVTLRSAPQAFVRVRVEVPDGASAWGWAAELMVPKWFDKNPALGNEDNIDQLRRSVWLAREHFLGTHSAVSAWAHHVAAFPGQRRAATTEGLNGLVAGYGPALVDRAIIDGLCRVYGVSVFRAVSENLLGIGGHGVPADLTGLDLDRLFAGMGQRPTVRARHTVGLVDSLTRADVADDGDPQDGLPVTLEEAIAAYGLRCFKVKVAGDIDADLARLTAIADLLDRLVGDYEVTLDGNEQFADADGFGAFLDRLWSAPALTRFVDAILYIEQPIARARALDTPVASLAAYRPLMIDESDDSLDAFPRARDQGYAGVSSKVCKGIYRSLLNKVRTVAWNAEAGTDRYFLSGEDLTTQAGLAVQQDLALVALLGLDHVERNGHHYVDGMTGAGAAELDGFADAHPDLYRRSERGLHLRIDRGGISLGSLGCIGFASGELPDIGTMRPMPPGRSPRT